MRLAVIDQQVPPMTLDQPQYPDLRVSTITPANMQLLQQAGAWQELAATAPTFQHMQVRLVQGEHGKAGCGDWLGGCLADVSGVAWVDCVSYWAGWCLQQIQLLPLITARYPRVLACPS